MISPRPVPKYLMEFVTLQHGSIERLAWGLKLNLLVGRYHSQSLCPFH